jgi:hypothetical protein
MKNKDTSIVKFITLFPKMVDAFPPPEPASKYLPEWYKKLDSYLDNDPTPVGGSQKITAKKCLAIFDILTSGYILTLPFDVYIDTTDGKQIFDIPKYANSIGVTPISGNHDLAQIGTYPIDKEKYIDFLFRLNLIWLVKTEPGYSTLFLPPQHRDDCPLFGFSAIIDTDTFVSDGLFSFFVKKNFKGTVKKGTPLIQAIPFKRDDFVSEVVVDQKELDVAKKQRSIIRLVFNSGYKKNFWTRKKYE